MTGTDRQALDEILNGLNRSQALRGENAGHPYELHSSVLPLVRAGGAAVAPLWDRIQSQSYASDPLAAELLLVVLGHIRDSRVDDLLLELLDDPPRRPKAVFVLGAINGKGWPHRDREDAHLLAAILPNCFDESDYFDPWYETTFQVCDLALGAFVRVAGRDHFAIVEDWRQRGYWGKAEFLGLSLPEIDKHERRRLQDEVRAFWSANRPSET